MTTPDMYASAPAYDPLTDAAIARAANITPDASPLLVGRKEYVPVKEKLDTSKAASIKRAIAKDGKDANVININPNIDRSYYAHELGHAVSETKMGAFVNKASGQLETIPSSLRLLLGIIAVLLCCWLAGGRRRRRWLHGPRCSSCVSIAC